MKYTIKFVISKYRRDLKKSPPKQVEKSQYAKLLFDEGAGWHGQKAD
ncbi:hypothetical protein [Thalassobacillus sp. CUG 92003]|nr:hypothetical protein [Thalassobacillus sp. CUG 92003]